MMGLLLSQRQPHCVAWAALLQIKAANLGTLGAFGHMK